MIDETTHPIFKARLKRSDEDVLIIYEWLKREGHVVELKPHGVAPTHAEWRDYQDHFDLEFLKDGRMQGIEVKGSSYNFTGIDDYRLPHFTVCDKYSFDRYEVKPFAYIMLNANRTHVAIVYVRTFSKWYIGKIIDGDYGTSHEVYRAPFQYVHFKELT